MMLPRVVPEPQYPGYGHNGQPLTRYTTTWSTRSLGNIPAQIAAEGPLVAAVVIEKKWEPKNTYENMCWALFLALFKLCCALAFTCLAVYHWSESKTNSDDWNRWTPMEASILLMAGLSNTVVAALAVAAFSPYKRGRITKRLVVVASFISLIQIIRALHTISNRIGVQAGATSQQIDGFYIAEVILASLILLLGGVILFPASEACTPFEYQISSGLRAISISVNTVVGAIVLIYFCFSIYGVHGAYDPTQPSFHPDTYYLPAKLALSTFALPITSLLLLGILGAYVAIGRGLRPHIVPTLVIGIVSVSLLLEAVSRYVDWLNGGSVGDYHDYPYVGMFALNFLTVVGVAVQVAMGLAFMVY